MSNGEPETRCKSCGRPVVQRPGRRRREFCNATCRQRHHRKQAIPHASVGEGHATPPALHEQLAALHEENTVLRTIIHTLFDFHEKLRDVKETARMDTQARPFKAWLKQARSYAGGRVVMDPKTTIRNCSDFWSRLSESPLYG
jgi:hypothetical protein